MQELFFSARRLEMRHVMNLMFNFVTEKEHNFQTDENIGLLHLNWERKKPNLSELTQVFFDLFSLLSKYFKAKISVASVPHLLMSPSQQLFGLFTQRYLFPIGKRTRCVMRPNNAYEGDYALTARKQLVDKNQPCNPTRAQYDELSFCYFFLKHRAECVDITDY